MEALLVLLGVLVSIVVQLIKKTFGPNMLGTYLAVIIFSLLGGALYYWIRSTAYWPAVFQILTFAGAFYTFILKQMDSTKRTN
jgi:hypothetical protein